MAEDAREALHDGRYAIIERLGEGGKGVVYEALDTVLDRVVAVKVLKAEGLDDAVYARFQREAQAAARLTHANVVATYDMGQDDGRYFLVMEFVDGSSLRDLLESRSGGPLDLKTLLRHGRAICGALEYAHAHGVLHRDLKPENIMIAKDGTAKLMDFGLALALDKPRLTATGTMVGTPTYMAPENALGKTSDARSDLYSLGVMLFEMATGQPPFSQEDNLKVIYSHIHDEPTRPSRLNADVTSGLEEVIMRLLSKDPARRYQSASDVARALRQIEESLQNAPRAVPAPARGEAPTPPRAHTPPPRKALPLVGRESEMNALRAAVDATLRGEGGVMFLAGEAGIGKTRLGEEMAAYATLRGARLLRGRCFQGQGTAPYEPWIEMLRAFVREAPPQLLYKVCGPYTTDLAKLVPELLEKVGPAQAVTLGHPDQERLRLFEAVKQLCLLLSQETPLVLFLDDLNWADPASLELLHYVARGAPETFFLILGAYRDLEVTEDHPLTQLLFDLNRERLLTQLSLQRLVPVDVGRMIEEILGEEGSDSFRDLVFQKTGGNPFFVEEVIRSLVEEGALFRAGERWDRRPIAEIRIPSSVRQAVRQRLSHLDARCNRVLSLAAVQGKEFDEEILKQVSGLRDEELLTALEDALRARLIEEKAEARGRSSLAFTDSQVRDVLYDSLSRIRRRQYHAKTARALEGRAKGKEAERVTLLAYHYVLADDVEKALDYSLRAGEAAFLVYAYEEAGRHLTTVLELLEEVKREPILRAEVLDRLGETAYYQGDADAAIEHWHGAAEIYEDQEERVRQGEALRKVAYAHFMEKHDQREASGWYEKARTILEAEPRGIELVHLYNDVARLEWRRGEDPIAAVTMCQSALELGEELDAHEQVSHAYQTLALLLPPEDKAQTMEYLERGLEIGREHERYEAASRAFVNLGVGQAFVLGDLQRAIETFEEGLAYVQASGYFAYRECIRAELAYTGYIPSGAWDAAMDLTRAVEDAPVTCKLHGIVYPLVTSGLISMYRGEWGEAEESLRAAVESAASFEEATFVAPQVMLGRLYLEKGDYPEAESQLIAAYEVLRKAGDHIDYLRQLVLPLSLLAGVALRIKEPERAARYAEELTSLADRLDVDWARAYADRVAGLLAEERGDWGAAEELLRRSFTFWTRLGAPYERARTLYGLGTMHQRQGEAEKAATALSEALTIFNDLGAKTDVGKVLARKDLLKA